MRRPTPITDKQREELVTALKAAKTKAEYQRVESVWLRAELDLTPEQIGRALCWAPTSVRRVQAAYLKDGVQALGGPGRGGRRNENLTPREEAELLQEFMIEASHGGIIEAGKVKAAYEARVGHAVPKSTIYRMLDRHEWRKLAPRPRHTKSDLVAQAEFKKNSPTSLQKKSSSRRKTADPSA
jgi:transposase